MIKRRAREQLKYYLDPGLTPSPVPQHLRKSPPLSHLSDMHPPLRKSEQVEKRSL